MKHRKISSKKELKTKIFKITSGFVIAGLVIGGFFVNVPQALAVADGDGTGLMSVSPSAVQSGSINNNFTFHFISNLIDFKGSSILKLTVPAEWANPQKTNSGNAGYVTIANSTCGNSPADNPANGVSDISISSSPPPKVVTVKIDKCDTGDTFDLQYNNLTAPADGSYTFITKTQDGSSGLAAIVTSPVVTVDTTAPVITVAPYTTTPVNTDITVNVSTNEGTLNTSSHLFTENASFDFVATDAAGNVATQTVTITNIDKVAPVITVAPYTTTPVNTDITVNVSTNEGTLNTSSHTFTDNGSFDFVATDAAGNVATQTVTITNIDKVAPVITLNGSNPFTLLVHTPYIDDGATASDNYDGDLTSSIITTNNVDADMVGSYSVTYNVVDAVGNVATPVTRTINVVDVTAPIINLEGTNPQVIEVGTAYSEFGATVTDDYDTDLVADIDASGVNTSAVGSYLVTYDAIDSSDNEADQVTRTVNVVDTTSPIINLTGSNPQVIEVGSEYSEFGATVTDNYDTDLVAGIDASGVNTSAVGSYLVTYDAVDTSGNNATPATRTVNVVDTTPPMIMVTPYTTAQTNTDILVGVSTNEGTLNVASHLFTENGSFDFVATDASGNVATKTVTITNIDRVAPVITRLSINPFNLTIGDSYTDPGATALDNADGDITANIVTVNPVNTAKEGTYTITYNVTDAAGNVAEQVTRTVIVTKTVVTGPSGGTPDIISPTPTPVIVASTVETPTGSVLSEKITLLDELIATLTPYKRNLKVKQLQQELKKLGLFSFPYFTNYYGPITNAGVKKYLSTK